MLYCLIHDPIFLPRDDDDDESMKNLLVHELLLASSFDLRVKVSLRHPRFLYQGYDFKNVYQ